MFRLCPSIRHVPVPLIGICRLAGKGSRRMVFLCRLTAVVGWSMLQPKALSRLPVRGDS